MKSKVKGDDGIGQAIFRLLFILIFFGIAGSSYAQETCGNGWACPAGTPDNGNYTGWKEYTNHVGEDYSVEIGGPIYAIADGVIVRYSKQIAGYGSACENDSHYRGGAMLVEHEGLNSAGEKMNFIALYGHNYIEDGLQVGDKVEHGQIIARTHRYTGGTGCTKEWPHLHFGIRPDGIDPNLPYRGVGSGDSDNDGWVDPVVFLENHSPPKNSPKPHLFVETIHERKRGDLRLSLLNRNLEEITFGPTGSIQVNGKTINGANVVWAEEFVEIHSVFEEMGIEWDKFIDPLHLKVIDSDGNVVAETLYPFSDVEPSAWYVPSAMKLWKENVISGYEGDKENTFKPGQEATRAEYLITALKSNEKANFPAFPYPAYDENLFGDVSSSDWFADYVQYAWEQQIEEGCDPGSNEFCPHETITRAQAALLTGRTFDYLRSTAKNYIPPAADEFPDVADSGDILYQYVYSLRDHHVLDGYADGLFRPENTVSRAEMVKFNCIAAFGVEECLFPQHMDIPFVTAVSPQNAMLDEQTTFTVDGYNLPDSLSFTLADCDDLESLGGNETQRQFRCTPTQPGEAVGAVLEAANGDELHGFTVTVTAPPIVTSVSPTTATYEEPTIFTVLGENLTNETAFWIAHCEGLESLGGDATSRQFQCTPSHETGFQDGVVKDSPAGNELFSFTLDVQEAAAPVQPTVTSVSPLTATYEEPTIFTVRGQNLPDTTAFWIDHCEDLQPLGGNTSERQFQCTPRYETGTQQGEVKDYSGGTELLNFSIEVQEETVPTLPPSVNSISPTTATLGESTVFTVNGQNLTSSTALWIDDCQDLVSLGGNTDQQRFRCTPSHQSGLQDGEVKDQPNGNILLDFSINVESAPVPAQPIVTSVAPLTATLSELTTFTVYGENLPVSTALYVAGCEDVSYVGGTSSARRFQCVPMYKAAIRDGLVKDEAGGTILYNFDVEVVPGIPTVTGVTPLNATKGERTTFVVSGTSLPETTTIWIDHCDSVVSFGGTAEEKVFECTPAYETGPQDGVVKDKSGGSTLHSFTVNFQ